MLGASSREVCCPQTVWVRVQGTSFWDDEEGPRFWPTASPYGWTLPGVLLQGGCQSPLDAGVLINAYAQSSHLFSRSKLSGAACRTAALRDATPSHAQSHDAQLHRCDMFTALHLSAAIMTVYARTGAWAVLIYLSDCSLQQWLLPPCPTTPDHRHNWVMQTLNADGNRLQRPISAQHVLAISHHGCSMFMQACCHHCRHQALGPPPAYRHFTLSSSAHM